ncbi:phage protein [Paenibacillus dendritiformis]|uniref:hypothetical protein n=1 Tax=Paenibacillus dendritiformis TaxID=130049 RepID=UPI001B082E89|nr:hypothetical protein [Paenibacillus dendritiformis]GIO76388.1 phage protein [Paenibacillus dendritiformis]
MVNDIKIGCYTYHVEEVECVNKFTPRAGEIDYFARKIRIDKDMDEAQKRETLMHEIIHGLEDFMCFELEEEQVMKLGKGLAMVFKDNAEILKRFTI